MLNQSGLYKWVLAQAARTDKFPLWLGHRNGKGKSSKRNCEDGSHEHHFVRNWMNKLVKKREFDVGMMMTRL